MNDLSLETIKEITFKQTCFYHSCGSNKGCEATETKNFSSKNASRISYLPLNIASCCRKIPAIPQLSILHPITPDKNTDKPKFLSALSGVIIKKSEVNNDKPKRNN